MQNLTIQDGSQQITGDLEVLGSINNDSLGSVVTKVATAAGGVQRVASLVESQVAGIADDGVITPAEKITLRDSWHGIETEYPLVRQRGVDAEVPVAGYEAAYEALRIYLYGEPGLLTDMAQSIAVDRSAYSATLTNYTSAREELVAAVGDQAFISAGLAGIILTTSAVKITRNRAGTITPSTVLASAFLSDGAPYSGRFKLEVSTDQGATWAAAGTPSSADEPTHEFTVPSTSGGNEVTDARFSVYEAGAFTRLLRAFDVPVSYDATTSAIYWGAMTTAPASGMIAGDYYFDSNLLSSGGGYIRYYDGSLWVQATSAWPYYAEARAKAVDDIVSWVTTNPGSSSDLVTYIQAFIIDLWTYDLMVGRTLRVGGRYATDGTVADEDAVGVYQAADGTFKVGSPKGEFIVDATTGDVQIVDLPLRSYTGEGVQRRAVQIDNESVDWLDCPDTTPATPEQMRARIGRLGAGGSILMDGEFLVNIKSTWGEPSTIDSGSAWWSSCVELSNGDKRVCYITGSYPAYYIVERTKSKGATTWSEKSTISTSPCLYPSYILLSNGQLRIAYSHDDALVEKIYNFTTSSWGGETEIYAGPSEKHSYIQLASGELRVAYDHGPNTSVYEKIYNFSTSSWGGESLVGSTVRSRVSYIQLQNGELRLAYSKGVSSSVYERLYNFDTNQWGEEKSLVTSYAQFPKYIQHISGEFEVYYTLSSTKYLCKKIFDFESGTWGSESTVIGSIAINPAFLHCTDGSILLSYTTTSGSNLLERTLQRYARVGAGIIESGNDGTAFIKFSDNTILRPSSVGMDGTNGIDGVKGDPGYQITGQSLIVSVDDPSGGSDGDVWVKV
jgi:hypothetical protein